MGRRAWAHARMIRSEPKNGAHLARPPETLELWFNELLDEAFNTVELFRAKDLAGKPRPNLTREKPRIDPKDRTHLTLNLPPLEPGDYSVEYRVLSRDGHTAPGRLSFSVGSKPS
jgi:copper resistance protein C